MNKKISLGAAIAFALVIAAMAFSITMVYSRDVYNRTMSSLQEREVRYEKLSDVDSQVSQRYYGSINEVELQSSIAKGYLNGIGDPYAVYYSPQEYAEKQRIEKEGQRVGIGAEVELSPDGYLLITKIYDESPAKVAGIAEESLIVQIDDTEITSKNNEKLLESLLGPDGSKITMTVRKDGQEQITTLTRREVPVPTIQTRYSKGGIGYIYISAFDKNTANQFNRELKKLEDQGAHAIILDLRGTTAKELSSASRILDLIIPAGPISKVVYKDQVVKELDISDTKELTIPIVTLANKETAGAAELFIQVLKDYDKAKMIGVQTAGYGLVQETIKLNDGSAIDLTVAQYISPVQEVKFHGVGIKADYEISLSAAVTDWTTLPEESDPQLAKAKELLSVELKKADLLDKIANIEKKAEEAAVQKATASEAEATEKAKIAEQTEKELEELKEEEQSRGEEEGAVEGEESKEAS